MTAVLKRQTNIASEAEWREWRTKESTIIRGSRGERGRCSGLIHEYARIGRPSDKLGRIARLPCVRLMLVIWKAKFGWASRL